MGIVFHIAHQAEWDKAQIKGEYITGSLEKEKFIHLSLGEQLIEVANSLYRDYSDLILLCIEENKLIAELKYEKVAKNYIFPHVYGPINLDAVVKTMDFKTEKDGLFRLPVEALKMLVEKGILGK